MATKQIKLDHVTVMVMREPKILNRWQWGKSIIFDGNEGIGIDFSGKCENSLLIHPWTGVGCVENQAWWAMCCCCQLLSTPWKDHARKDRDHRPRQRLFFLTGRVMQGSVRYLWAVAWGPAAPCCLWHRTAHKIYWKNRATSPFYELDYP